MIERVAAHGARHLLRDTRATLATAGFAVDDLATADVPAMSLPHRFVLRGTARPR